MIKKYEFPSQAVAYSELNAQPFTTPFQSQEDAPISVNGFLRIKGAENAVDLSANIPTDKYCVDVMWRIEPPSHLAQYEINPNTPNHTFA